jgi:Ser/Thr protein kinase RdoA (MazF antagonist)
MSELISEYASDYINMGENTEERQNYLNGACTAWNIAILDEKHREEALRRAIEGYKRMNPGTDDAENFEQDLRTLIKKKLEMFPEKKKVIIDAMIEPISETKYRINIASTDDKELLKEIFKKDPNL